MNMTRMEKLFVNSRSHSTSVARKAMRMLDRIPVRRGDRYLDVGCGNGAAPLAIARATGLDVTGVDADPAQIEIARHASNGTAIRFLNADATRLPFDDHAFDIVSTNKTMHHIPDWEQAFREMARVLKPGGYFLFGDFIGPEWLASLLKRITGAACATTKKLDWLTRENHLTIVAQSKHIVFFTAVWQRKNITP
jgi:ubiquinone/menaquinone biosynthesis C-methylase UbiE